MRYFLTISQLVVLILTLLLSNQLPARDANKPKGEKEKEHIHQRLKPNKFQRGLTFKELDTDGNGLLNFVEFSNSPRLRAVPEQNRRKIFDRLDRNKDGNLTVKELWLPGLHWRVKLRRNFHQADIDKDGFLDIVEFMQVRHLTKMPEENRRRIFKRLDSNADQRLSKREIRFVKKKRIKSFKAKFLAHDKNGDGNLNYAEYSELPFVKRFHEKRKRRFFRNLDKNNDGKISPKEIHRVGRPNHHKRKRPMRPRKHRIHA